MSDTRTAAATLAADAYRGLANTDGDTPQQVRIVSTAQLRRDGGEAAVRCAMADILRLAKRA